MFRKAEAISTPETSAHIPKRTRQQLRPKTRCTFTRPNGVTSRKTVILWEQHFVMTVKVFVICRLKIPHLRVSIQHLWISLKLKLMIQKSQNENQWPETSETKANKNQITETSCTCKRCVPSWCTAYVKCAVLLHNSFHLFPTRLIKMNIISFNVCQTAHRSKSYILKAQGCCEDIWE